MATRPTSVPFIENSVYGHGRNVNAPNETRSGSDQAIEQLFTLPTESMLGDLPIFFQTVSIKSPIQQVFIEHLLGVSYSSEGYSAEQSSQNLWGDPRSDLGASLPSCLLY